MEFFKINFFFFMNCNNFKNAQSNSCPHTLIPPCFFFLIYFSPGLHSIILGSEGGKSEYNVFIIRISFRLECLFFFLLMSVGFRLSIFVHNLHMLFWFCQVPFLFDNFFFLSYWQTFDAFKSVNWLIHSKMMGTALGSKINRNSFSWISPTTFFYFFCLYLFIATVWRSQYFKKHFYFHFGDFFFFFFFVI